VTRVVIAVDYLVERPVTFAGIVAGAPLDG
jgi:hypothetical protein